MSLGNKVISARKKNGLTQEELAERASVTVRTIQRIESGESIPRDYTLKAIAAAFGMAMEDFTADLPFQEEKQAERMEGHHFLQLLNLSAFSYLVIPFVHFLIPIYLLKKIKEKDNALQTVGQRIIRQQIYWTVSTHLLLLLALVYNIVQATWFDRSFLLNYLWVFAGMYLLNAFIIFFTAIKIRNNSQTSYVSG